MEIQKGYCEDCCVETNTNYCKDCGKKTIIKYEKCKTCGRVTTFEYEDEENLNLFSCFLCTHVQCSECDSFYLKKDGYCKECAWNCKKCQSEKLSSKFCPNCGESRPKEYENIRYKI